MGKLKGFIKHYETIENTALNPNLSGYNLNGVIKQIDIFAAYLRRQIN